MKKMIGVMKNQKKTPLRRSLNLGQYKC